MARILEAEAMSEDDVYGLGDVFADLRGGIWAELESGTAIDPYRRNLQRGYLERLDYLMTAEVEAPPPEYRQYIDFTPVDVSQSDIRARVRAELKTLREDVQKGLRRTTDDTTRMHLNDVLARIDQTLEGEESDA
jgi:hypothetical protein